MTTLEMEYALMNHLDVRRNYVVPNISWGMGLHECDLLSLSKSLYATEVEIKISKQDLIKDKLKTHGHNSDLIKYLYFAVPVSLLDIAFDHIPERAGLITVERKYITYDQWPNPKKHSFSRIRHDIKIERTPKANTKALKWSEKQLIELLRLGTIRCHRYTKQLFKNKYNNSHNV